MTKHQFEFQHPEGLTNTQEELLNHLFDMGAIKFGDFKLKLHDLHPKAPLSPIYIDLRVLRRFPKSKKIAIDAYQELIKPLYFDLLADIPTAATPFVASLSDRLGVGMITPRTDSKGHGSGAKIDGYLTTDKGKTALLIDDLVTKADSKLEAAEILLQEGLKVFDVVVLIDREQGGKEELAEKGLALHSALKLAEMLDYYKRVNKINTDEYINIKQKLLNLNVFLSSLKNQQ